MDEHFGHAVWVIRDVADRCAVLSKDWSPKDLRQWVNLPDRASVEDAIRSTGLDQWARELDAPLNLRATGAQPVTQGKFSHLWKLKSTRRRVADEFVAVASTYRKILEIRRAEGPDWFKEHTSAMLNSTAYIAGARNNVLWAAAIEDNGAVVVSEALLLVGQGVFLATHAPPQGAEVFPSTDYLYEFMHKKGGYRWLSEHRKEAPEWLTPR